MVIFKEKHIFRAHQESILQSSPFASDIQDHHRVGYQNILPLLLTLPSEIASEVWRSEDPNDELEQNKSPYNVHNGILPLSAALSQSSMSIAHIIWNMTRELLGDSKLHPQS